MKRLANLQNKLTSFRNDTSGNFLILTALMIFVIIGTSGFALDYSRSFNAQSKITGATDSAVLAVGNNLLNGITDEAQNRETFEAMLNANLEGIIPMSNMEISSFVADAETGQVNATISASVPMTLMRVIGFENVDINVSSGAIFEQQDVEITMVLDNTGSMGGSKINALRAAAEEAVNILIPQDTSNTVRIGLVPYSASVNAGEFARLATRNNRQRRVASLSGFELSNRNVPTRDCVTERGGSQAATDARFGQYPVGSDDRTVNPVISGMHCPSLEIRPLTNIKNVLINDINSMSANGATAGHIGIAWAYYMLSENWNDLWPTNARPAAYSEGVKKVAIIMTDGIFNTFYNGTENLGNIPVTEVLRNQGIRDAEKPREFSEQLSRDLCDNMKALKAGNPGITVYTVAFDAPTQAQQVLQYCANDDTAQTQFYFEADNEEELQAAFRDIAEDISSLRLAQ